MDARRIEAGPLIVALGAIVLLVSLFLDWYDPGVTAWEVFEVLDLVLAALAVVALLAALGQVGVPVPTVDARWLGWTSGLALVLVAAAVLDHPPAARGADPDTGLWIALAASALMAVGALLTMARVRVSFDVSARRQRVAAVDARRGGEPAAAAEPDTAEHADVRERDPWGLDDDEPPSRPSSDPPESKL